MSEPAPQWEVKIERSAVKVLRRLPKDLWRRIDKAILDLSSDPRPPGYKKLRGYERLYRLRVGSWRIIYAIYDDKLIVLVLEVAPRGRAYRNL